MLKLGMLFIAPGRGLNKPLSNTAGSIVSHHHSDTTCFITHACHGPRPTLECETTEIHETRSSVPSLGSVHLPRTQCNSVAPPSSCRGLLRERESLIDLVGRGIFFLIKQCLDSTEWYGKASDLDTINQSSTRTNYRRRCTRRHSTTQQLSSCIGRPCSKR